MRNPAPPSDSRKKPPDRRATQGEIKPKKGGSWRNSYKHGEKAAVRALEMDRRAGDEFLEWDGWKLPGTFPEEQGADCGKWMLFECRDQVNCGARITRRRKCMRAVCPYCWKAAMDRATKRIVKGKILPFVEDRKKQGKKPWPVHLTVSFPESYFSRPLQTLRKKAAEYAKKAGMTDGVAFVHPWRAKATNGGAAWVEGIHVHFLAFGWIDPVETKRIWREKGIIIQTLKDEETGNSVLNNPRSLHRVVWYNLSHSATKKGRSTYQFYGELQRFSGADVSEGCECPVCTNPLDLIEEEQVKVREEVYQSEQWENPPHQGLWIPNGEKWVRMEKEIDLKRYLGIPLGGWDRSALKKLSILPAF